MSSARGFMVPEEGHVVNILPPTSSSAGVSSQAFNLRNAAHVSILLQYGVLAEAPGAVTVNAGTDLAMAGATAIPFNLFKQETSGTANDVMSERTAQPATGYAPPDVSNIFYSLEIDADTLPEGYAYLQLVLAPAAVTTDADYASAIAILSGLRFAETQGLTVTT
ncbi:MAG: hypothetical protein ACYDC6_11015 [Acidobacteriaceae bacterium]